ncbi:hypothetical protein VC83_03464 [Pseudogymnoascus destructans]|uniref:Uncharacterized protein n=2 Tax=Pseudogymnoascus destructans TaxID=655981 RepID=L8FS03_PSED2|nr:uncharacterized protein VC83_03464 [Pseudogymnoascus destructans]ELR03632.1 hypothetical protein GMDG_06280 [Pseudogymnoascus destructans 20631-21]OAF60586.1 hypothetical protein VC83_03464 [Pseudogymnoascus destructans]
MPRINRSEGRNVHIFNAADPTSELGGLIRTRGVTNKNLYDMIEIFVVVTSEFTLRNDGDMTIAKDDAQLEPGNYFICAADPFELSDEAPLFRAISLGTGSRTEAFRNEVRHRDRRCVVTGHEVGSAYRIHWRGFEVGHIFPIAYEAQWTAQNFSRWITILPERGGSINSVQNGLLLRSDIHQLFDGYDFAINPDDNYKIVFFVEDTYNLAGTYLDRRLLDDPQRPVDQLFRWHFRQAVLVNMKGAGAPEFEHDFPPGADQIGEILSGPQSAERMEYELFSRFASEFDGL